MLEQIFIKSFENFLNEEKVFKEFKTKPFSKKEIDEINSIIKLPKQAIEFFTKYGQISGKSFETYNQKLIIKETRGIGNKNFIIFYNIGDGHNFTAFDKNGRLVDIVYNLQGIKVTKVYKSIKEFYNNIKNYINESKSQTYDSVDWQINGKHPQKIEFIKSLFSTVMKWLKNHKMLSKTGIESFKTGIDEDFSITSDMLTIDGNKFLTKHYNKWISSLKHNNIDTKYLDNAYKTNESIDFNNIYNNSLDSLRQKNESNLEIAKQANEITKEIENGLTISELLTKLSFYTKATERALDMLINNEYSENKDVIHLILKTAVKKDDKITVKSFCDSINKEILTIKNTQKQINRDIEHMGRESRIG